VPNGPPTLLAATLVQHVWSNFDMVVCRRPLPSVMLFVECDVM
jgi:hypothetical protein